MLRNWRVRLVRWLLAGRGVGIFYTQPLGLAAEALEDAERWRMGFLPRGGVSGSGGRGRHARRKIKSLLRDARMALSDAQLEDALNFDGGVRF